MAVSTTRMVLLGAVCLFEPVNGYQIRRELMSWRVDEWANIKPGSIYHGLGRLAEQGLLTATTLDDAGREVSVYQATPAGRELLADMLVEAVETVNVFDRSAFMAAFGLVPLLGEEAARASLTRRRDRLAAEVEQLTSTVETNEYAPPHAVTGLRLWAAIAATELSWLTELAAEWGTAATAFGAAWVPPADDPGHQIAEDRQRYLRLLSAR